MKVRYTRLALTDLEALAQFTTEIRDAEAARAVIKVVRDAIEVRLTQFPDLGRPGLVEETRELVIPRLELVVVYRIGEDDALWVLSVLHGSHEPRR